MASDGQAQFTPPTVTEQAKQLLSGAVDLHVHSAPDVVPRKGNDIEMAQRARAAGMAGLLIKSHYMPTADRAALVNSLVPDVRCFGSICLNHSLGGLNPIAVEMAARAGTKLVWFPTVDGAHEIEYQEKRHREGVKRPYWYRVVQELREKGRSRAPITIFDDGGQVVTEVYAILEIAKSYDMIVATAHLSVPETKALVRACKEVGVEKIVVTHPDFPSIAMPDDVQLELVRLGALMERTYSVIRTGMCPWEQMQRSIRHVGISANIISSDVGQPYAPWPDEALAEFAQLMLDSGFAPEEIESMAVRTPRALVGM